MFFVLLPPAFAEDEGRYHLLGAYPTEEAARACISDAAKKSKGFYRESSFVLAKAFA